MKQMGAASRKKLNIALLILLLVALVVLAAVLFVRAKPDAVSPDNRIETAEPLSLALPRTALSAIFDDTASPQTGGYSAVPLTGDLSLPNSQLTMDVNEQLLPGDTWTETFNVNARFRGTATIRFTAALENDLELPPSPLDESKKDKGTEKLSSQLSMTVKQGDTVIYSGALAGLADEDGKGVTTSVPGSSPAKVPYTVTLKLNEEADNRYQGKQFKLLLKWQLDDTGGGGSGGGTIIVTPPKTGDDFSPLLMGGAALVSLSLLAVLVLRRRKGENHG